MSVAYLPTLESLWRWKRGPSPEPMEKWGINIIIALIGLLVDLTGRHDYLAMVYPLRALILCVVVAVLIRRWEQKSKAAHSRPDHFLPFQIVHRHGRVECEHGLYRTIQTRGAKRFLLAASTMLHYGHG